MNAWAAFALGIFVGVYVGVFFLSIMATAKRADHDMDREIAMAMKELDEHKAKPAE